jgi:hypothetical protein
MKLAWNSLQASWSIRHTRARGNPALVCAQLAWIPAFAGMTEPTFSLCETIALHAYLRQTRRSRSPEFNFYQTFVLFLVKGISESNRQRAILAPRFQVFHIFARIRLGGNNF